MAVRGLNKVDLVGRLGGKPVSRVIQGSDDQRVVALRLAVDDPLDRETGGEGVVWLRVLLGDRFARQIEAKPMKKGQQVGVRGRLATRNQVGMDGREYPVPVVLVDRPHHRLEVW